MEEGFGAMRLASVAASTITMLLCTRASAFVRPALRPAALGVGASSSRSLSVASSATVSDTEKVEAPELLGKKADFLRNAGLTAATGEVVKLGDVMGDGKSVVIFLRHLG